jgi:hypothetical protein
MRAKRLPEDFLRRPPQEQKQLLRQALEDFMPIAIERLVVETEAGE